MNSCPKTLSEKQKQECYKHTTLARATMDFLKATEKNLTTLWNYTPDNTNEFGDKWNEEDLSIYSLDNSKRSFV